jgi:hypothetical protein
MDLGASQLYGCPHPCSSPWAFCRNCKSVQEGIKLKDSEAYLAVRHILNPPRVLPGGVWAECVCGVGSLILMPVAFLLTTDGGLALAGSRL